MRNRQAKLVRSNFERIGPYTAGLSLSRGKTDRDAVMTSPVTRGQKGLDVAALRGECCYGYDPGRLALGKDAGIFAPTFISAVAAPLIRPVRQWSGDSP